MKNNSKNKGKSRSSFSKKPLFNKEKGISKRRPGAKRGTKKNEKFSGNRLAKNPSVNKKASLFNDKRKKITHK
jgi:hypothetical protein